MHVHNSMFCSVKTYIEAQNKVDFERLSRGTLGTTRFKSLVAQMNNLNWNSNL